MIVTAGGLVASAFSPAFTWGLKVIDWLDRADYVSTGFIDLLRWLFSPTSAFALTGLFLVLFVLAVLYVIRTNLRPQQTAQEAQNIPVGETVDEREGRIKELENERDVALREREHFRRDAEKQGERAQAHGIRVDVVEGRLKELKTKYKWLYEIAESDKADIDKFVVAKDPAVNYEGLSAGAPYFVITFNVVNYSVYQISIDPKEVEGAIYRNDEEISGNLKMVSRIENLARGDEPMVLELKQWVSPQEIPLLINPLLDTVLKFDRIKIYVKGGDGLSGIAPQRLRLPSGVTIKETQPPNLRVEELRGSIKELEQEKENLVADKTALAGTIEQQRTQIERQQRDSETQHVRLSVREGLLEQFKWLHEMAEEQAKDIGRYVVVERVRFCYHEFIAPIPYLIFAVDVRNKSVFDITIEDEVKGHITIAGERLHGEKELIHNPKIPPSGKGSLTLKQRLGPTEVNLVAECEKEPLGAFYYFEKLEIMITTRTESPRFERTPLKLPEHISSKDDEVAQLKNELASLHRRSETIVKLSLALGGAYTLEQMFEAGESPSRERIEHWFNSTLRGHIHPDELEALREGLPELTDSPAEQRELISMYCSKLRRRIAEERRKP